MSNYSKIYWLTRLDSVHGVLQCLLASAAILLIVYFIFLAVELSDGGDFQKFKKSWSKYTSASSWIGIISVIILIFLPTKNEMILIYAGGKTMDFVQQDSSLSKIPSQSTYIITEYLNKTIKEFDNEKTK